MSFWIKDNPPLLLTDSLVASRWLAPHTGSTQNALLPGSSSGLQRLQALQMALDFSGRPKQNTRPMWHRLTQIFWACLLPSCPRVCTLLLQKFGQLTIHTMSLDALSSKAQTVTLGVCHSPTPYRVSNPSSDFCFRTSSLQWVRVPWFPSFPPLDFLLSLI